jgi:hypothetical protein
MNPIRLAAPRAGASNAATLTSGLPALAMMKVSALAAFSICRES